MSHPAADIVEAQIVAMLEGKADLAQEAAERLVAAGKERAARDQFALKIALNAAAEAIRRGDHRTIDLNKGEHQ